MAAGVDLAMFSGDKLLGGPQAGLVVGRRDLVASLRRHPLYRALRVDKVTLAALEATLVEHAAGRVPPVRRQAEAAVDEVAGRAEAWAVRLRGEGLDARAEPSTDRVGGGSLPGQELPSAACVVTVDHVAGAARALRLGSPPVVGRVHDGRLWLHPRTVPEDDDDVLLTQVASVLSSR
jgi:L-seryl-tRNA(Ser) seleniumtransferase